MHPTVPINKMPIRLFETYDSYERFVPMLYDRYWQGNQQFSSICYEGLLDSWKTDVNDMICNKFGFAPGTLEEVTGPDYGLHSDDDMMGYTWIPSLDLTYYDKNTGYWSFEATDGMMQSNCYEQRSLVLVECMAGGQDCLMEGHECATDLDCCDQMFCSPISGNCTNPVE